MSTLGSLFDRIEASSTTPLTERNVPSREPWLSDWCRLHSLHLAALAVVDANEDDERSTTLRAAAWLARAKDDIYYHSVRAR